MSRNVKGYGRKPHKWRNGWRAYLTTGYKPDGTPVRDYVYGRTRADCMDSLQEAIERHELGAPRLPADMTLTAYLTDWLQRKALEISPRTRDEYERELKHVTKHLGRHRLAKLQALDIQRMMLKVEGSTSVVGKRDEEGKGREVTLSARAANQARGVLSAALQDAVRFRLIPTNPAALVRPLKHKPEAIQVWTAEQIKAFLTATRANAAAHHALFYLALTTGMRPGELMALHWTDFEGERVHVQRTITRVAGQYMEGSPKTKASNRVLLLPSDTLETLELHRRAIVADGLLGTLVFPSSGGKHVGQSNLRRALHSWAAKAEVDLIRPHDLRHTYASMAIAAGMTPADLARQLGHTDAGFTMRKYVHFFERMTPRTAPTLNTLLEGVGNLGGTIGGTTSPNELALLPS